MSSKVTFVDPQAASEYDCGICLSKLVLPVYIGCGSHLFCNECIINLLNHHNGNKFPCPSCRASCHVKNINRMQWIDRRMDQLQVRCCNFEISLKKAQYLRNRNNSNFKRDHYNRSRAHRHNSNNSSHSSNHSSNNRSRSRDRSRKREKRELKYENMFEQQSDDIIELCDWIGDWSNLRKHKSECPYHVIKCKYCHVLIIRKDTYKHNIICNLYPIMCDQCHKNDIPRHLMSEHLSNECLLGHIQCNKCKQIFVRKNMAEHKLSCPEIKINCDYFDSGCKIRIKRKDYEKHNKEYITLHLQLIKKQNNELKCKNINLENKLNECEERISDMEHKINILYERVNDNSNSNNSNNNNSNEYFINIESESDNESQQSPNENEYNSDESASSSDNESDDSAVNEESDNNNNNSSDNYNYEYTEEIHSHSEEVEYW